MALPVNTACPFCGAESSALCEAVDENRRVSDSEFHYRECVSCRLIFLLDPPDNLAAYYEAEYYEIPDKRRLEEIARKDTERIDTVLRFVKRGKLLEIGPAFGIFAWQAKAAGFEVDVVEMDGACCEHLRRVVGVNVIQSEHPELVMPSSGPHDVIVLWHVLEHVRAPLRLLEAAARNLNSGGFLFIGTPNPTSIQFRWMGRRWPHLDAPRHLQLIPKEALDAFVRRCGLSPVFCTDSDRETRHWNRFSWERLLMNRCRYHVLKKFMLVIGRVVGYLVAPFERGAGRGSAYTVVYQLRP